MKNNKYYVWKQVISYVIPYGENTGSNSVLSIQNVHKYCILSQNRKLLTVSKKKSKSDQKSKSDPYIL